MFVIVKNEVWLYSCYFFTGLLHLFKIIDDFYFFYEIQFWLLQPFYEWSLFFNYVKTDVGFRLFFNFIKSNNSIWFFCWSKIIVVISSNNNHSLPLSIEKQTICHNFKTIIVISENLHVFFYDRTSIIFRLQTSLKWARYNQESYNTNLSVPEQLIIYKFKPSLHWIIQVYVFG